MEKNILKCTLLLVLMIMFPIFFNAQDLSKAVGQEWDGKWVEFLPNEFTVNTENSKIKWSGGELSGKEHHGLLKFKSGDITIKLYVVPKEDGKGFGDMMQIIEGKFIVDMNTLSVEDLQGTSKEKLEGHLRSDDFFSVKKFDEAILEIPSIDYTDLDYITDDETVENELVEKLDEFGFPEVFTCTANGNLTIKGKTHPVIISFKLTPVSSSVMADWEATMTFDRSKYDVRFRSGNFFQNLGDKLIYDDIKIETSLKTSMKQNKFQKQE